MVCKYSSSSQWFRGSRLLFHLLVYLLTTLPSSIFSLHGTVMLHLFTSDLCCAHSLSCPNSAVSVGAGEHSSTQTGGTNICPHSYCFLLLFWPALTIFLIYSFGMFFKLTA